MTNSTLSSHECACHKCGYDLRAQPPNAICPECAFSVAESIRQATIPKRPSWANSDPRWRRRILAGLWLLTLVPLFDFFKTFGLLKKIYPPNFFAAYSPNQSLDETMLAWSGIYQCIIMSMGLVLLFSKERGRHPNRTDRLVPWGVFGSYIILFMFLADICLIVGLVTIGIGALFQSIALNYQPSYTDFVVQAGCLIVKYGPQPGVSALYVIAITCSITVALACIRLTTALRAAIPPTYHWLSKIPPTILITAAALNLAEMLIHLLGLTASPWPSEMRHLYFFQPSLLATNVYRFAMTGGLPALFPPTSIVELAKWLAIFASAVWLTLAQIRTYRHLKLPPATNTT